MPDVTPPLLVEARRQYDALMETMVAKGVLRQDWRWYKPGLLPPCCDVCDDGTIIDPDVDDYRVGIDGSWAHEHHFTRYGRRPL